MIEFPRRYEIDLYRLSNNNHEFVGELIEGLEATTTLVDLTVNFHQYKPTRVNNQRVIEPLCRCISNLRHHNKNHPLEELILTKSDIDENGISDVYEKFLVAAKRFGILYMEISSVHCLPIQFLVEFCRDNNVILNLKLIDVSFSSGTAALPLPLNNGPQNNSFILTLDKLVLGGLKFENSAAATIFANLLAHVNIWELDLYGSTDDDDEEEDGEEEEEEEDDGDDIHITERILSELKFPSAKCLTSYSDCRMEHFKAALDAGTTTVTTLEFIHWRNQDKAAKLQLLASFIRRAVKLWGLRISFHDSHGPQISLPPHLFQALEACATVMHIKLIRHDGLDSRLDLSPDEMQQLQNITSRNRELDRFATNPGTYPTEELPELMLQFDNCPTGRYMLARRLPEVRSFAELHAMHLSRKKSNLE